MTRYLKAVASLLSFAVGGCGDGGKVLHTDEATTEQLNQISANTVDAHALSVGGGPYTHDEVRQGMGARAAEKPRAR